MQFNKWFEILIPVILAVPLALMVALVKPTIGLAIVVGVLVLLVAFLSTTASLYILIFSMLLGPEFLVGALPGGGTTAGRGLSLRFEDVLLIVIGVAWLAKVAFHKGLAVFTRTSLNRPIMLFIAASVFATLLGVLAGRVQPLTGFFYLLKYYEYVFLYFMVVNAVTSGKQVRGLVVASLVACFLVSLFAIAQIPGGERASAPFEGEMGEPNTLGGYLVFMLAIVAGLWLTSGALSRQLPLAILTVVGGVALVATLSRASFVAAGVVFLIVLGILGRRKPQLFPLALLVVLTVPWWIPGAVTERLAETFTQAPELGQIRLGALRIDTSTSERLRGWEESLELFQRSPLYGMGVSGGPFMDAMYPRVLVETGLLGSAAFLYLLWAIYRMGLGGYRSATEPFTRGLALGFLLGFVGLLVHALAANTFIIVRIMEPFWLYAALVARSLLVGQSEQASQPQAAFNDRGMRALGRPAIGRPA